MFRVDQREFYQALEAVRLAAGKAGYIPIAEHVHLDAESGGLVLTCTDLEVRLSTTIDADGKGEMLLPVRKLAKMVKPTGKRSRPVSVGRDSDTGKPRLHIDGAVVRFQAEGVKDDWPTPAKVDWQPAATYDAGEVQRALKFLMPAVCKDESRPSLCRVVWRGDLAVVTDGHRMHVVHLGTDSHKPVYQARAQAAILLKLLRPCDGPVKLAGSDDGADTKFSGGSRFLWLSHELTSRVADGEFPDHEQVIPRDSAPGVLLKLERECLLTKLKKAEQMFDGMVTRLDFNGGASLKLTAMDHHTVTGASAEWDIPNAGVEDTRLDHKPDSEVEGDEPDERHRGQPVTVYVEGRYLRDALLDGEVEVKLKLTGSLTPVHLRSGVFESVIMPRRC